MEDIVVSVMMLCYNHEEYVAQAIESVLMQETNFRYEIVIGDDASTDHSQDIIMKYAEKYPDVIVPICRKKNIGASNNAIDIEKRLSGKYVAVCECDDYWNEKEKLQIQVDFLEKNIDYSMCFTDVNIIKDSHWAAEMTKHDICKQEQMFNKDYSLKNIPSVTILMRNYFKDGTDWIDLYTKASMVGDRITHMLCINHGKLGYIPIKTATYRHITNKGNSFSSNSSLYKLEDSIKAFKVCKKMANKQNQKNWNYSISNLYKRLFVEYRKQGKKQLIKRFMKLSFEEKKYSFNNFLMAYYNLA